MSEGLRNARVVAPLLFHKSCVPLQNLTGAKKQISNPYDFKHVFGLKLEQFTQEFTRIIKLISD